MADAPKEGSSNWSPFEMVLGILLVIALLSNITGKSTPTVQKSSENIPQMDSSTNRCGLSVTSPTSLTRISIYEGSVHLSGSVNGCNWKPSGNTALFAQIISGTGIPVSDFVAVQNSGGDFINTAFNTSISLTGTPAVGTGYLILIPAVQDPNKPITVRIPLKFVR